MAPVPGPASTRTRSTERPAGEAGTRRPGEKGRLAMSGSAPNESVFTRIFWADVDADRVQPLEHYLARFPGCEAVVRGEYAAFEAGGPESSAEPTPPDPSLAPELPPVPVSPDAPSSHAPRLPDRFGDFCLVRELGRGGMGVVYLAEQVSLHRNVALKVIRPEWRPVPGVRERFQREALAASRLDLPGICPVYEVGEVDGTAYMAMRYLEGETLAARIARMRRERDDGPSSGRGPSSFRKKAVLAACRLAEKTARALHVAHEQGLVHRDLKPGNIMVTGDDEPVILDFGLVRIEQTEDATLTRTGQILGTPAYMAPEQLEGDPLLIDRRTDVYALGATLYELLTLHPPFEAPTHDQLYHLIRTTEPKDPRHHNRAVPRDLAVVVETALARDRARRYRTARDLADDLERFRSDQPIRARPVHRLVRMWKWMQRNPGRATALAATLLVVLAGTGLLIGQRIARDLAVTRDLKRAETLLAAGRLADARTAIGRAQGMDARSPEAAALQGRVDQAEATARKQAAFEAAARAREEARQKSRAYRVGIEAMKPRKQELDALREACTESYAPTCDRARLARKEQEFDREDARLKRLLSEAREALERAFRLESPHLGGKPSDLTRAAFADFFLRRFRALQESGDLESARHQAERVRRYDPDGRRKRELLGRGTLTVTVKPPDAAVYLFRYESYETVRKDPPVVPRLVPVPTTGTGRCRPGPWLEEDGFYPGDLCQVVTAVEKDSIAAKAGLKPGDLVVRLNGQPCGDGLFVAELSPRGAAAAAGVKLLDRIQTLGDEAVEGMFEWEHPPGLDRKDDVSPPGYTLVARDIPVTANPKQALNQAFGLRPGTPANLVNGTTPAPLELLILRAGEPFRLTIPEGKSSGLSVEVTAYPLILSAHNRVPAARTLEVDPGSYLLLVRRDGFEDQRFAVMVPRLGRAKAHVDLLEDGTTPPGFVYVPPGPFVYGGDPEAFQAGARQTIELPGFFLARKEVTNREWFAFVNDPRVRRRIDLDKGASARFVPRQPGGLLVVVDGDHIKPGFGTAEVPVMGISWNDIQVYLQWRNQQAEARNERVAYALPDDRQWEKAARGVDERFFPWGNRFDPSLTVGKQRKKVRLHSVPGGFEPRDESPFGILDAGGSRYEWCGNKHIPGSEEYSGLEEYYLRGGAWGNSIGRCYRVAARLVNNPTFVISYGGFRLTAHPRDRGR